MTYEDLAIRIQSGSAKGLDWSWLGVLVEVADSTLNSWKEAHEAFDPKEPEGTFKAFLPLVEKGLEEYTHNSEELAVTTFLLVQQWIAADAKERPLRALTEIQQLMSGQEWNACLCSDIADVLRQAGFPVEEMP